MTTPVLFRTDKSGEVTAVFPTMPGSPGLMTCYAHAGQHGSCSRGWLRTTKPAAESAYRPLLAELIDSIGYDDLNIVKRISRAMDDERNVAERRV